MIAVVIHGFEKSTCVSKLSPQPPGEFVSILSVSELNVDINDASLD